MKSLPNILRNLIDNSITLSLPNPKFSLIWMHGLGDSPEGFLDYFLHPLSPLYHDYRIKLIAAPKRFVTIANQECRSWYDVMSSDRTQRQEQVYNLEHVENSTQIISKHVDEQVQYWKQTSNKIFPQHRIVIGGFSQGAAMALKYGFECKYPLAGIVGYSGYLLQSTGLKNLGKTNVLINHGKEDDVIPFDYSMRSYNRIKDDLRVKIDAIRGQSHTITLSQLSFLTQWLKNLSGEMEQYYQSKI